jgi:ribonuclease BN (tRNA processing enzyme)
MRGMTAVPGRLRLTVLGCSTALPDPASACAGYLVEWGETAILFDAGLGVIRGLEAVLDPRELTCVVIGHMHADHYLDLAGLRYLFPWAGEPPVRLPVHLPPGGRQRLESLANAISERPGFFDDAFRVDEYDPDVELAVGALRLRFMRGQHYVPAWGVSIVAPDGARLVYTGDTGPTEAMTEFARGCDLLLVEATLRDAADDDPRRGHLTPEEAIELATDADPGATLLVHYPPARRHELESMCSASGGSIRPAVAGLTRTITPARSVAARPV